MSKIIFLGTDLHSKPSELAAKLVRDLKNEIKNSGVLSIQNRKPFISKSEIIIPKIFNNNILRKAIQGFLLPFYLIFLRLKYDKVFSFWVSGGKYHSFLFRFMKILGYKIIFTMISYRENMACLNYCDKIICQSEEMKRRIKNRLPDTKIEVILPWTDLKTFCPNKKMNSIVIPSVPYKLEDFNDRGMFQIIKMLQTLKIESKIIFRSQESYEYFKKIKLKNSELMMKNLSDKELAEIMNKAKVIPLIYLRKSPDMPLSAIEGLASGCAIVCTSNMGLAEIVKKQECGIVANSYNQVIRAIKQIFRNSNYNKNARRTAENFFDKKKNMKRYLELAR